MRTALGRIRLFIDTYKIVGKHFISNGSRGEESKIAERENVCEAAHGGKGEIASVIK